MSSADADLQAVFFDMDGTLVNSEELWLEAEIAVCAELGGVWTPADQAANVGGPTGKVARLMLERAGRVGATEADVAAIAAALNTEVEHLLRTKDVHWMPGAQQLLKELTAAGVPCALVSASFRALVDAVLDAVGRESFVLTVAGDEVEHTKPAPDAYLQAAQRLAVDPARCVVLEDSGTGVRAGEAAGCVVVAIPSVAPIEPARTRTVVTSLEEIDLDRLRTLVAAGPIAGS